MAGGGCVHGRGGMCDRGMCMVGGHAWWGVHGRGSMHWGACMAGGVTHTPPGRYYRYGIRSMSGRYASYWNAFLLIIGLLMGNGSNPYLCVCYQ